MAVAKGAFGFTAPLVEMATFNGLIETGSSVEEARETSKQAADYYRQVREQGEHEYPVMSKVGEYGGLGATIVTPASATGLFRQFMKGMKSKIVPEGMLVERPLPPPIVSTGTAQPKNAMTRRHFIKRSSRAAAAGGAAIAGVKAWRVLDDAAKKLADDVPIPRRLPAGAARALDDLMKTLPVSREEAELILRHIQNSPSAINSVGRVYRFKGKPLPEYFEQLAAKNDMLYTDLPDLGRVIARRRLPDSPEAKMAFSRYYKESKYTGPASPNVKGLMKDLRLSRRDAELAERAAANVTSAREMVAAEFERLGKEVPARFKVHDGGLGAPDLFRDQRDFGGLMDRLTDELKPPPPKRLPLRGGEGLLGAAAFGGKPPKPPKPPKPLDRNFKLIQGGDERFTLLDKLKYRVENELDPTTVAEVDDQLQKIDHDIRLLKDRLKGFRLDKQVDVSPAEIREYKEWAGYTPDSDFPVTWDDVARMRAEQGRDISNDIREHERFATPNRRKAAEMHHLNALERTRLELQEEGARIAHNNRMLASTTGKSTRSDVADISAHPEFRKPASPDRAREVIQDDALIASWVNNLSETELHDAITEPAHMETYMRANFLWQKDVKDKTIAQLIKEDPEHVRNMLWTMIRDHPDDAEALIGDLLTSGALPGDLIGYTSKDWVENASLFDLKHVALATPGRNRFKNYVKHLIGDESKSAEAYRLAFRRILAEEGGDEFLAGVVRYHNANKHRFTGAGDLIRRENANVERTGRPTIKGFDRSKTRTHLGPNVLALRDNERYIQNLKIRQAPSSRSSVLKFRAVVRKAPRCLLEKRRKMILRAGSR